MEILILVGALYLLARWIGSNRAARDTPPRIDAAPAHHAPPTPPGRVAPRLDASEPAPVRDRVMPLHDALRTAEPSVGEARGTTYPEMQWVPVGTPVEVAGRTIAGGGFYFGTPPAGIAVEPSLIDPRLPVRWESPDWRGNLGYWPSYADLTPGQRAAYLGWLHAGRERAGVDVGYAFLLFYALERRLIVELLPDARHWGEVPLLVTAVKQLEDRFGVRTESMTRYTRQLIDLATSIVAVPQQAPSPALLAKPVWNVEAQLGLGTLLARAQPLPPDWALLWSQLLDDAPRASRYSRSRAELGALFAASYRSNFPAGLRVPAPRTRLRIEYKGAAQQRTTRTIALDVPDVSRLTSPVRPLCDLLTQCVEEIAPLEAARRRNAAPPALLAALPARLAAEHIAAEFRDFHYAAMRALGSAERVRTPVLPLFIAARQPDKAKHTKRDATQFAQLLEHLRLGIEPDVRFGGRPLQPSDSAVLFRLAADPVRVPTESYQVALLLLHIALSVAAAADAGRAPEDLPLLLERVGRHLELAPAEFDRLRAHGLLVSADAPKLAHALGKARRLSLERRRRCAELLVAIATADGQVQPGEARLLERIYRTLDLDANQLHTDLHHASTGHVAPKPGAALDPARIADIVRQTREVEAILAPIFETESSVEPPHAPPTSARATSLFGLDAAHSALARQLLADLRSSIARTEFEIWCEPLGLPVDGAIEVLNDKALDLAAAVWLEGDDPIELNESTRATLDSAQSETPA